LGIHPFGWLFYPSTCNQDVDFTARIAYSIALTCPKASMRSVDGSERADMLPLMRIGVKYRETTELRLKHGPSGCTRRYYLLHYRIV